MTDPLEGRTRRQLRADLEEETRLVERQVDDDTRLAERRAEDETRRTPQRSPAPATGTDAAARRPSIAHGRADTPRVAAVPGVVVPAAVYGPRRGEASPPITRSPVAPPTAPASSAPPRRPRRAPLIAGVVLGAAAIVAGAVWGIILIVGGGM